MQSARNQVDVVEGSGLSASDTRAHRVSLAIWDVSTPVEEGGEARVKVGAKCEHCCSLSGSVIQIQDAEGRSVAKGALGDHPAPGTAALYWTEIEFQAPAGLGYHEWTALLPKGASKPVHTHTDGKFGMMVVGRALCRVAVDVKDGASKAILPNAYVRLGGNTLFTDDSGNAVASVPMGIHDLIVWKRDHKMFRTTVEITKDDELKVELTPAPCKYCPDHP